MFEEHLATGGVDHFHYAAVVVVFRPHSPDAVGVVDILEIVILVCQARVDSPSIRVQDQIVVSIVALDVALAPGIDDFFNFAVRSSNEFHTPAAGMAHPEVAQSDVAAVAGTNDADVEARQVDLQIHKAEGEMADFHLPIDHHGDTILDDAAQAVDSFELELVQTVEQQGWIEGGQLFARARLGAAISSFQSV